MTDLGSGIGTEPGSDHLTTAEDLDAPITEATAVAADLLDERLIQSQGFAGYARLQLNRLRSGELGSLPVILGLIVISIGFYSQNAKFLSSRNLVSITQFAAPIGIIALGIVLVLLLGEIDLSVGSVSGLAAACMAVMVVNKGHSTLVGLLVGMAVGVVIGLSYGLLYTRIGVPSFVFSLAGLLGFQGLLLYVLGKNGTINLPRDFFLVDFARTKFLGDTASYVLVALIVLAYLGTQLWTIRSRSQAELSTPWLPMVLVKAALMAVGLGFLTYYVNIDRGWTYLWLLFVLMVVVMDFVLRRTTWGRHVFAVGGNVEAARRSGIKVNRIYISVFMMTSLLAAVGGLLNAGLLTSVSQASGTTDTNLTAIAAAVIGGTSLFGGRGSAYSALLGILVLQAITSGLNLIHVDSSVRFMVTGGVLLVAVAIDSVSRRARSSSGRG
jgi:D-xylose transport system permease protein